MIRHHSLNRTSIALLTTMCVITMSGGLALYTIRSNSAAAITLTDQTDKEVLKRLTAVQKKMSEPEVRSLRSDRLSQYVLDLRNAGRITFDRQLIGGRRKPAKIDGKATDMQVGIDYMQVLLRRLAMPPDGVKRTNVEFVAYYLRQADPVARVSGRVPKQTLTEAEYQTLASQLISKRVVTPTRNNGVQAKVAAKDIQTAESFAVLAEHVKRFRMSLLPSLTPQEQAATLLPLLRNIRDGSSTTSVKALTNEKLATLAQTLVDKKVATNIQSDGTTVYGEIGGNYLNPAGRPPKALDRLRLEIDNYSRKK